MPEEVKEAEMDELFAFIGDIDSIPVAARWLDLLL